MTALTVSTGGDILHRGPIEECLHALRTYAHADRVLREDGVLLATAAPWSQEMIFKIGFDQPGAPRHSL